MEAYAEIAAWFLAPFSGGASLALFKTYQTAVKFFSVGARYVRAIVKRVPQGNMWTFDWLGKICQAYLDNLPNAFINWALEIIPLGQGRGFFLLGDLFDTDEWVAIVAGGLLNQLVQLIHTFEAINDALAATMKAIWDYILSLVGDIPTFESVANDLGFTNPPQQSTFFEGEEFFNAPEIPAVNASDVFINNAEGAFVTNIGAFPK